MTLTAQQLETLQADPLYQQFVSAAVRALTAMLTGQPQPESEETKGTDARTKAPQDSSKQGS